jgi:hypothetical protein
MLLESSRTASRTASRRALAPVVSQESRRRRRRKPPLPAARSRWPRRKQPHTARRPCRACGRLDRAVSSRSELTYYGPARCESCGEPRDLRKVARPIDYDAMRQRYQVPSEMRAAGR